MSHQAPSDELIKVRRGALEDWLSQIVSLNTLGQGTESYGPTTIEGKHREIVEFFAGDGEERHPSGFHLESALRVALAGKHKGWEGS